MQAASISPVYVSDDFTASARSDADKASNRCPAAIRNFFQPWMLGLIIIAGSVEVVVAWGLFPNTNLEPLDPFSDPFVICRLGAKREVRQWEHRVMICSVHRLVCERRHLE